MTSISAIHFHLNDTKKNKKSNWIWNYIFRWKLLEMKLIFRRNESFRARVIGHWHWINVFFFSFNFSYHNRKWISEAVRPTLLYYAVRNSSRKFSIPQIPIDLFGSVVISNSRNNACCMRVCFYCGTFCLIIT